MRIAVLSLQGAFIEHEQMLQQLGHETFQIRKYEDWLQHKDGLIIPGGESTTMIHLLNEEGLMQPIRQAIIDGLPVMGTCAGLILLAKEVENDDRQRLATMDIVVRRNAYGRQLGSFMASGHIEEVGKDVPMTFIRAPYIKDVQGDAKVLATYDGHIIAARQGKQMACAFHPELTGDTRWHEAFLALI